MSFSGRKRASLILLLILAAGLVLAGAAAAARAQEMACCPAGMESGCTWLGAGDCCSERPAAQASTSTATPPGSLYSVLAVSSPSGTSLVAPLRTCIPASASRSLVLRL